MASVRPQLTDGEWAIIRAVWGNEPCAAPTVQETLAQEKGWSYSTVKTMMDRMVAKGLLKTEKIRNLTLYRSSISRVQAQKREVLSTVRRAFNGAMTPMMQFLLQNQDLTSEQLDELEGLIQAKRKNAANDKR